MEFAKSSERTFEVGRLAVSVPSKLQQKICIRTAGCERTTKTTAALTSGGGGYKNIMKNTSPYGGFSNRVCIIILLLSLYGTIRKQLGQPLIAGSVLSA